MILKGLDDAVANMHVGDRYHVTFGGDLAFGAKGRPSAPGKPRIPPNAEVDYEVLFRCIQGKLFTYFHYILTLIKKVKYIYLLIS